MPFVTGPCFHISRDKLPPGNVSTARGITSLGRLYVQLGKPRQAEPLLREAMDRATRTRRSGDNGYEIAGIRGLLGRCLLEMDRYDDAEPELLAAVQRLQQQQGPPRRVRPVIKSLVALYEAWDKPDEAAQWRAKLPGEPLSSDASLEPEQPRGIDKEDGRPTRTGGGEESALKMVLP